MKERPILFSGPMVWAILEGRKTQTRRVVKPQPPFGCKYGINGAESHALCSKIGDAACWVPPTAKSVDNRLPCPYGKPGDRLWVKETHSIGFSATAGPIMVTYLDERKPSVIVGGEMKMHPEAPDGSVDWCLAFNKRPSIHMPRWASRITLEIVRVRVERLQDISLDDAKAEGPSNCDSKHFFGDYRDCFRVLWDSINGKPNKCSGLIYGNPWASNPWVWVVEFRRINTDGKELKGS